MEPLNEGGKESFVASGLERLTGSGAMNYSSRSLQNVCTPKEAGAYCAPTSTKVATSAQVYVKNPDVESIFTWRCGIGY